MKTLLTFLLAISSYLSFSADPFILGTPTTGKSTYYDLSATDTFHVYVTFNKSLSAESISLVFYHPGGGATYRNAPTRTYLGKNPAIAASNALYRFVVTGDAVKLGTYEIEIGINSTLSKNKSLPVTFAQTDPTDPTKPTSILEELTPEELYNTEYYTIQGVRVVPNTPGVYIRVRGYRRETILIQ